MNGLDIINKLKKQKEDESTNEKILKRICLVILNYLLGLSIPKNQSKLIPRSYICRKLHIR